MKRITSLDFLRGLAMICMMGFHVMLHVSWHANDDNFAAVVDQGLIGILVLVFLLANFRALFLMVSMTVYAYTMTRRIRKGVPPEQILKKNLIFAAMLYLVALFTESFAANWGVLGRSIYHGEWYPEAFSHIMHFETLQSISWSIAILSIIMYFMAKKDGIKKEKRNVTIFVAIAVLSVVIGFILDIIMHKYWPEYYTGAKEQYTWNSFGEFFLKLILAGFVGVEQPIFPFLATVCIGAIIGYKLAQDKVSPSLPKKSMLIGLIMIIAGALLCFVQMLTTGILSGSMGGIIDFVTKIDVFPAWFFLVTTGVELIIMMWIMRMVEFSTRVSNSDKIQKFVKKTIPFRRWGMVSLTLFVWQVFPEFLMRWIGMEITGIDFMSRQQAGGVPTIIMIIVVLVVWDLIFRLWEKAKFKGTAEHLMSSIAMKLTGAAKGRSDKTADRMNIDQVLYHPEPIVFVEND